MEVELLTSNNLDPKDLAKDIEKEAAAQNYNATATVESMIYY